MRALLISMLLVCGVGISSAQSPVVRAKLVPAKGIIVGQPVHLIVEVMVPNFFTGTPDFPTFEVDNVIVVLPEETPENFNERINGQTYAGIRRTYFLYPQQPGDFRLPPALLTVPYAIKPPQTTQARLTLPRLTFHADIPLAAQGLSYFLPTTQLTMQQHWNSPLNKLSAGDTVERTITVTTTKMQGMLIPPLPLEAPPGIRIYPEEPKVIDQKTDRGEFVFGRRTQSAKYFIQKAGDYSLPAIELKWWKLNSNRLVTATIPATHFTAASNPNYLAELPPEPEAVAAVQPQYGKNHLGDKDEYLPTNHGFDEFFGNLYHLNAEEEPERPYWFSNSPDFLKSYNPRGAIHSYADGKIEDTGPLNVKRMETIDDETTKACSDFITKQAGAGTPFFAWMNFTRMHVFTHVRPEYEGKAGMGKGFFYADGMWEMDQNVGKLLKVLDDLHIADNTIVVFTTHNGPNMFTWPDAAVSPFRSEKDSNWEGAFRVPAMIRWPGHIKAGEISNEVFSGLDWFPTLLAAAGNTTITDNLLKGTGISGKTFKVHLDGYNQLPYLTGQQPHGARDNFLYFDDDGQLVAMRFDFLQPGATTRTAWNRVLRTKGPRPVGDLGQPVYLPTIAEDVQSADGSL